MVRGMPSAMARRRSSVSMTGEPIARRASATHERGLDRRASPRRASDAPVRWRCGVEEAVVQPVAATLPELDRVGSHHVSAPVRRPGHLAGEARRGIGQAGVELLAPADDRCSAPRPTHPAARRADGWRSTRRTRRRPARCTGPVTCTCRSSSFQRKTSPAHGFSASWRPLRLSRFVKNWKPRSSTPRSSTWRTDGRPRASAVATAIAFGSGTPARLGVAEPAPEQLDRVRRAGRRGRAGGPRGSRTAHASAGGRSSPHRRHRTGRRCPRQDSNLRFRLRRPALYPLSYGGGEGESSNRPVGPADGLGILVRCRRPNPTCSWSTTIR